MYSVAVGHHQHALLGWKVVTVRSFILNRGFVTDILPATPPEPWLFVVDSNHQDCCQSLMERNNSPSRISSLLSRLIADLKTQRPHSRVSLLLSTPYIVDTCTLLGVESKQHHSQLSSFVFSPFVGMQCTVVA